MKPSFRTSLTSALFALLFATTSAWSQEKPNILVIWGDDVGWSNISAYNLGMMGFETPNIDRIAEEGALFTHYYAHQSCTAGRSAFITGQHPYRTGLTKVGLPGADLGLKAEDATIKSVKIEDAAINDIASRKFETDLVADIPQIGIERDRIRPAGLPIVAHNA